MIKVQETTKWNTPERLHMIKVQETTKWNTPNHIYFLSKCKTKCYGYTHNNQTTMFNKPMNFDTKHRTFKQINE